MDSILLVGLLFGYGFGTFIGGVCGRLHWEWRLNNTKIYLHHWIVMSFALIFYLTCIEPIGNYHWLIIGFLVGGVIHGLSYNDRFKIITL